MYFDVNICKYMYIYMHTVEGPLICSANLQHIHLIAPNDRKTTCHATHMNQN